MKHRKVREALRRRQGEFVSTMPNSGQECHKPGSQNSKKGYGVRRGRRPKAGHR